MFYCLILLLSILSFGFPLYSRFCSFTHQIGGLKIDDKQSVPVAELFFHECKVKTYTVHHIDLNCMCFIFIFMYVFVYLIYVFSYLNPIPRTFFHCFQRERKEERSKERENHQCERETLICCLLVFALMGDRPRVLGVCPHREPSPRPVGQQDFTPTSRATSVRAGCVFVIRFYLKLPLSLFQTQSFNSWKAPFSVLGTYVCGVSEYVLF